MRAKSVSVTRQSVTPKALVIALCALALVLAAGSLAVANISPHTTLDRIASVDDVDHDRDETAFPEPVMGDELFVVAARADGCIDRNVVAAQFLRDQAEIGGRVFDFVGGRSQKLADLWRARTGVDRTVVSGIMTHVFFDRGADEWTADQVEFDAAGCAMSRTLLPSAAWDELFTLLGQS